MNFTAQCIYSTWCNLPIAVQTLSASFSNSNSDDLKWRRSGNCHIQLAKGRGAEVGGKGDDGYIPTRLSVLLSQHKRFWSEIVFRTVGRELTDLVDTTGYKDSSSSPSKIRYYAVHLLLSWQAKRSYYSSCNSHSVW